MKHRKPMAASKDKKIFRNTAQTTKTINVKRKPTRGGIRL